MVNSCFNYSKPVTSGQIINAACYLKHAISLIYWFCIWTVASTTTSKCSLNIDGWFCFVMSTHTDQLCSLLLITALLFRNSPDAKSIKWRYGRFKERSCVTDLPWEVAGLVKVKHLLTTFESCFYEVLLNQLVKHHLNFRYLYTFCTTIWIGVWICSVLLQSEK